MRIRTLALAGIWVLSTVPAFPEEAVVLPARVEITGQVWREESTGTVRSQVSSRGTDEPEVTEYSTVSKITLTYLQVKDGVVGALRVTYDPDCRVAPEEGTDPAHPLAGRTVTVRRKEGGGIELDPPEDLPDTILEELQDTLDNSDPFAPGRPVRVGESWEIGPGLFARLWGSASGIEGQKASSTLEALESRPRGTLARIRVKAAGRMSDSSEEGLSMSGPVSLEGPVWTDLKTGEWWMNLTLTMSVTGSFKLERDGKTLEFPMTNTTTSVIRGRAYRIDGAYRNAEWPDVTSVTSSAAPESTGR